jgi:hypothetical protein
MNIKTFEIFDQQDQRTVARIEAAGILPASEHDSQVIWILGPGGVMRARLILDINCIIREITPAPGGER